MDDKYFDQDLDTPTETDLENIYGGRFLSQGDIGTRKIRTKIKKVGKEELQKQDGSKRMRIVLGFDNIDKSMVVNATIKDLLVAALGKVPAKWIGASVGIFVDPTVMFAGKRVGGLRLRVLEPAKIKPAPQPAPAPKKPAVDEWPEEEPGDPGFEPDDSRDLNEAAE
jgi:hypothetical protein